MRPTLRSLPPVPTVKMLALVLLTMSSPAIGSGFALNSHFSSGEAEIPLQTGARCSVIPFRASLGPCEVCLTSVQFCELPVTSIFHRSDAGPIFGRCLHCCMCVLRF